MTSTIRVYHSPDADDRFMFWPIREGLVKTAKFSFEFFEADTQALNETASHVQPEVCAISAIHYGRVHSIYEPLLMGASVGSGYGPIVVCPSGQAHLYENQKQNLHEATLLTPGLKTTAHGIVSMLEQAFAKVEVVAIAPMELVFKRLHELANKGEQVVALLIHEGRLIYKNYETSLLFDVGERWTRQTGALLPLGINVIHRGLPREMRNELSGLFQESCRYAIEHRDEYIQLATTTQGRYHTPLSSEELERYLDMYANEHTLKASGDVQKSFKILIEKAAQKELFEKTVEPVLFDWI